MFSLFNRLPDLFGGRITGSLYYGALCKVVFEPASNSAKMLFFGGEVHCFDEDSLKREVDSIIKRHKRRSK